MKVQSTISSLDKLTQVLRKWKKAFYIRFGDIDLHIIDGELCQPGKKYDRPMANNRTVFTKDLQKELHTAFCIDHPKYMRATSGDWKLEPGMTSRLFAPFANKARLERVVNNTFPQGKFYHPWLFQYLSVFEQSKLDAFLNEFVKPKRKMFVGNVDKSIVELVCGHVDFYIETPKHNSYETIDEWYPQMVEILRREKQAGNEIPVILLNTGQASRVVAGRAWNDPSFGGHFLDFGSLFHAVADINDRLWIKKQGDAVRKHFPVDQKIKHFLLTRMNYASQDPEWLNKRLEIFNKLTLPSIKAQTNQDFKWIWLCNADTPEDQRKQLSEIAESFNDTSIVVRLLYAEGPMDDWQKHFRAYVNDLVSESDLDMVITSRLDNDDILHPDYMAWIRKHAHNKTELLDVQVLQFDANKSTWYNDAKYNMDKSSPFCSLIEPANDKIETVVACDHGKLRKRFGTFIKIQEPLAVQVCHDDNILNRITGEQINPPKSFMITDAGSPENSSPDNNPSGTAGGSPTPEPENLNPEPENKTPESDGDNTPEASEGSPDDPIVFKTDHPKFVIPYIIGPENGYELRYALRSLAKNFKEQVEVVIIGDKPDWIQNVTHIPIARVVGMPYNKFMDLFKKVDAFLKLENCGSGFYYSYDDVFFIDKTSRNDIYRQRALEDASQVETLFEKTNASNRWKDIMKSTLEVLKKEGRSQFNFETHLPRYYKSDAMREIIEKYKPVENPYQMASLYFNNNLKKAPQIIGMDGAGYKFSPKLTMTVEDLNEHSAGCKIMNLQEQAISEAPIREFLEQMFPEQSVYEKKS